MNERVAHSEAFEGLTKDEISRICACGTEVACADGQGIIEAESASSDLFILVSGRVRVEMEVVHQDRTFREELVRLKAVDVFGEMAFLQGRRRTAHVAAHGEAVILQLDGRRLYALFDRDHHLGYVFMGNLARILAHRLVDTNFKWRSGLTYPPPRL